MCDFFIQITRFFVIGNFFQNKFTIFPKYVNRKIAILVWLSHIPLTIIIAFLVMHFHVGFKNTKTLFLTLYAFALWRPTFNFCLTTICLGNRISENHRIKVWEIFYTGVLVCLLSKKKALIRSMLGNTGII